MSDHPFEVFLRSVWMNLPSEDDISWVKQISEMPSTTQPLGDYGSLVKRMLECGVSEYEIARFAKIVSYEVAFGLMYVLEDPSAGLTEMSNPNTASWGLFQMDPESGKPTEQMTSMHECILRLDPSGREMRPRDSGHNKPLQPIGRDSAPSG